MADQIGLEAVMDMSNFNKGMSQYTSGLDKMDKATAGLSEKAAGSFNRLGKSFTDGMAFFTGGAAINAIGQVTSGIVGFASQGVVAAKDLDAQLATIAAGLGKTKAEIEPLNKLILELGLDPNLKVSATEAADAIDSLARNGLDMTQILDGAAKSTVLLANSTGADFGQAADIATDVMAMFNIEAKDMNVAVNGITSVAAASKFTIDDYQFALAAAGGVASAVGVDFNDFNTSVAAISPSFASGSDAGTSFKTMLQRMVPSTDPAREAFAELGLLSVDTGKAMQMLAANGVVPASDSLSDITEAMRGVFEAQYGVNSRAGEGAEKFGKWFDEVVPMQNAFFDANGAMLDMATITQRLNDATSHLSEEQRNAMFTTMFGSDAMRAAFELADSGEVVYTDMAKAMKETELTQEQLTAAFADGKITQFELLAAQQSTIDASEQAATRMDTLQGAWEIFQGIIETLQLQIGQAFLPVIRDLVELFSELATRYSPMITAAFSAFGEQLRAVIGAVVAFVQDGERLTDWNTHMTPGVQGVVDAFFKLYDALTGLQQQIATAIEPITSAVAKFVEWQDVAVALGGAFLFVMAPMVVSAIAGIVTAMAPILLVLGGLTLAVAGVRYAWENNWGGIQEKTAAAINAVTGAIGPLGDMLTNLANVVLPVLQQHWQEIAAAVTGFAAVFAAAKIPALIASITTAVTTAGGTIGAALAAINLPLVAIGLAVALFAAAWTGNWFGIRDKTMAVIEQIKGFFQPLLDTFSFFGSSAIEEVKKFVTGQDTQFSSLKAVWEGVKHQASLLFSSLTENLSSMIPGWEAGVQLLGGVFDGLKAQIQLVMDTIGTVFSEATALFNAVISGDWSAAWTAAGNIAKTGGDFVIQTIQNLVTISAWDDLAKAAWSWIQDAIPGMMTGLAEWWTELSGKLAGYSVEWGGKLAEWSTKLGGWLTDAAAAVKTKFDEYWTNLQSAVDAKVTLWKAKFDVWKLAAGEWLVGAKNDAKTKFDEWYTELSGKVDAKLSDWQGEFAEWETAINEWMSSAVDFIGPEFEKWYTALTGKQAEKFPDFQGEWLEWGKASLQWLADAALDIAAEFGKWFTSLVGEVTTKATEFGTKMVTEFAPKMILWIADKTADIVPEFGKWLGKLTAEVVLGAVALAAAMAIDFPKALIGWITGTDADPVTPLGQWLQKNLDWVPGAVETFKTKMLEFAAGIISWITSPEADPTTNLTAFGEALKTGLNTVKESFILAVQEFTKAFWDTIDTYVDWNALGSGVMTKVQTGAESMKDTIVGALTTLTTAMTQPFKDMASGMFDIGASLLDGIIAGFESVKQSVIDKITEFTDSIPEWMKSGLGISSPSKVTMKIGQQIVQGLIVGIENTESKLMRTVRGMTSMLVEQVQRGTERAVDAFASMSSSLSSVGDNFASGFEDTLNRFEDIFAQYGGRDLLAADPELRRQLEMATGLPIGDMLDQSTSGRYQLEYFRGQQRNLEILQQQSDLIDLIRQSGADPAQLLQGVTLGLNADPKQLLGIVQSTMTGMNYQLERSIKAAASAMGTQIEDWRKMRDSIEDIESRFEATHVNQLESHRNKIRQLDDEILRAEQDVLLGRALDLTRVDMLHKERTKAADALKEFMLQGLHIKQLMERLPTFTNKQAQEASDAFVERFIEPIQRDFDMMSNDQRGQALTRLRELELKLRNFKNLLPHIEQTERRVMSAADGFGDTVKQQLEQLMMNVYDPMLDTTQQMQALGNVNNFANGLRQLQARVEQDWKWRSVDEIKEFIDGTNDQMSQMTRRVERADEAVEQLKAQMMESGNVGLIDTLNLLEKEQSDARIAVSDFLSMSKQLREELQRFSILEGPGKEVVTGFFDSQIQPLVDAFAGVASQQQRQSWLATIRQRLQALNTYQINMQRLVMLQKDLSEAAGLPMVARFKTQVLDDIARQLENINLSDAQRNKLMADYEAAQNRVLAIQKQQADLKFLQDQLAMVSQIKQLAEEYGDVVNPQNLLSGIQLGIGASLDNMLLLTDRTIQAILATVKKDLGINSPSTVFADFGGYMMEGLALGMKRAAQQPLATLQAAIQPLPYTMSTSAVNLYMGGVNINNGMDMNTFEQRVRQIVNRSL